MWIPIIIPFGTTNKSKVLDNEIRTCVNCHNTGVQLVRNDAWAHLFFLPFCKVKSGQPYLHCPSCGATIPYVANAQTPKYADPNLQFQPKGPGMPIPQQQQQQQQHYPMYQDNPEYQYQQQHDMGYENPHMASQYPNDNPEYQQQPQQQQQPYYVDQPEEGKEKKKDKKKKKEKEKDSTKKHRHHFFSKEE
ncbi:hypothetical protein CYY_002756 [Polysphondylium violaceum]|uniref:Zinc-ribbon 15 domain-containing protein n=1 Tax=Polysphondylium violaceum TaxID=133409 RepID=A0A8J4PXN2_9MYCE|nr:hypothetical protein CYY_002756 [Polysphondylium violaceum]